MRVPALWGSAQTGLDAMAYAHRAKPLAMINLKSLCKLNTVLSLSLSLSLSLALLGALLCGSAHADTLIYVVGGSSQFGTLDLQTRAYSQITTTTQPLSGLAAHNGQLYATSLALPSILYTLSDTGTLASMGGLGTYFSGLAFNASGTLYANDFIVSSDHLGTLNPSTGAYANIGSINITSSNQSGVLAFSNGVLYDAIKSNSGNGLLASLNLTSGAATQIGSLNSLYINMILFDAQNVLYGIGENKNLYSINTSTAALNLLGAITGSNLPTQFFAAVAGPTTSDVPEPATLGLFAIGGLALRWRGKRSH